MACFWLNPDDVEINIPNVEIDNNVIYYVVEIKMNELKWSVKHRYNDFYDLHQTLIVDHGVSKDSLPPKKVINNKCPEFIQMRKEGLETYLRNILNYLKRTMPRIFTNFLDFHHFDTFFLLQSLAFLLYSESDNILRTTSRYTFDILQLHSISQCFKRPYPSVEETDKRYDIGHVLDFCFQLQHLTITGLRAPYKTSNIIPNELDFNLHAFRNLLSLCMDNITFEKVTSLGFVRNTLNYLSVQNTTVASISEILMCDVIHKTAASEDQNWVKITELDLSNNKINSIDQSIILVPSVQTLNLSNNKITKIDNLTHLLCLSNLNLSNNQISDCSSLHTKFGKITSLDLSLNGIVTLKGFEKLYSLENLDVSSNKINDINEIKYIGTLPCLENFRLTGNPVAVIVDYRVKVFEYFGRRASEIYLDNEKATQKEIDTAHVLQALRIAKEGKIPNLNQDYMY